MLNSFNATSGTSNAMTCEKGFRYNITEVNKVPEVIHSTCSQPDLEWDSLQNVENANCLCKSRNAKSSPIIAKCSPKVFFNDNVFQENKYYILFTMCFKRISITFCLRCVSRE